MKAKPSMAFETLAGKDGNVVARRTKSGFILTPHVIPRDPSTPAQESVRGYFTKASRTFKGLTNAQVQAWRDYAQTITFRDPVSGKTYHPTDIAAFMQLSIKYLQVTPTGTIPVAPPANPYTGDSIGVTATAGTGKVTFTASAANSLTTKTELLLQRLKGPHWTPTPAGYRSKAFVAFAVGALSADVTVTPGYYAAAYRFINVATGQATELQPLPIQQVTLSLSDSGNGSKKKAA